MKKKTIYILLIAFLMIVGINSVKAKEDADPCLKTITKKSVCENCGYVYNKKYKFCSNTGLVYVACGLTSKKSVNYSDVCKGDKNVVGFGAYDISPRIPELTSFAVNLLKIITPVILIFMGMITMVKAIASSNEDEIQKAQKALIKKIIIAVMIFFVVGITQFVVAKVSDSASKSLNSCLDLFLNGNYKTVYYRTGLEGKTCYTVNQKS